MLKVKVIKCTVSTLGPDRGGLQDYQVSDRVNDFCKDHDVIDVKVSTVVPKRHNNGGFDWVELWHTILYREGAKRNDRT